MNVVALTADILLVFTKLVLTLLCTFVHIAAEDEGTSGVYSSDLWMLVPVLPLATCASFLAIVSRRINQARA